MTSQQERDSEIEVLKIELGHIRELMALRDKAMELQAKEYERRLAMLNHEADQLKSMQINYMPREVAEKNYESLNARVGAVEKSLWRISGALAIVYIVIQFLQKYKVF